MWTLLAPIRYLMIVTKNLPLPLIHNLGLKDEVRKESGYKYFRIIKHKGEEKEALKLSKRHRASNDDTIQMERKHLDKH